MTKQRKKAHRKTKTDCAKACPDKKDKVAQDYGKEIREWVAGLIKESKDIVSTVGLVVSGAIGIYSWAVDHKMIAACAIALFIALVLSKVLLIKFRQSMSTCILAGILCFGALTIVSLAGFGYVHISDEDAADPNHGTFDNIVEFNEVLAPEMEDESVDSTESPEFARAVPFEEQIESQVWRELLSEVVQIGITGTQKNFEYLCEAVLRVMDNYTPEFMSELSRTMDHEKLSINVDKAQQLSKGKLNWDSFKEICLCRKENFGIAPGWSNAHLMGQAGLDCVLEMGKVNGKGTKGENPEIYNVENLILYGGVAIDGFAGNWYFAKKRGESGGDSYFLGEVFHHLGDASELTTETLSVAHLILSAIFYKQEIGGDDDIYWKGLASEQQYKACKNIAIVFDKLDNKIQPEDPYFLLGADKYYTYSLYNSNLTSREREKIERYLSIVEEKKRRRGIPLTLGIGQ